MDIFRNLDLEEVKMTPYWQLQKYPVGISGSMDILGALVIANFLMCLYVSYVVNFIYNYK